MKSPALILFFFIFPFFLFAQTDTTSSKNTVGDSKDILKSNPIINPKLPPRAVIINMKDLKEIKNLEHSPYLIIDDWAGYTSEELASGLSEKELADYKKNKKTIKQLLVPPPSEEETYPAVSTIKKILRIAKTVGVTLILILSLL